MADIIHIIWLDQYTTLLLQFRLNISVSIDPRLLKLKIWNYGKEYYFYQFVFYLGRWLDLLETENVDVYGYYPQHKEVFHLFLNFIRKMVAILKNVGMYVLLFFNSHSVM